MLSKSENGIIHVILAAGASTRMGEPKQLLPWSSSTLIEHAIAQSLAVSNNKAYVVLGAHYDLIYQKISHLPISIIRNLDWESGMGSSISKAITVILQENVSCDGVLISLADQPLIDAKHLTSLIQIFEQQNHKIVASGFEGISGVPAIFSNNIFKELQELDKDFGARKIIKKYKDALAVVDASAISVDIDTKIQYNEMIARHFPKGNN